MQIDVFDPLTESERAQILKEIGEDVAKERCWVMNRGSKTRNICQTLRRVYHYTQDPDLKEDILLSIAMGQRMYNMLYALYKEKKNVPAE